jgi:choline dehydrogenase-like flavoprotein
MFHLNELLAIWPERAADFSGPSKTIALRDFYYVDQRRLGLVQSLGLSASYGNIVQFLNDRFDQSPFRRLRLMREFLRLPALAAERLFGNARVLAAILEDLPCETNRVELVDSDRDRMKVTYALTEELLARRRYFRSAVKRSLGSLRSFFLNVDAWPNLAHPCGTARFGTDPSRSVLDRNCRAHGVENLYVVDSSFMPTSMGVNPSLMIAANALRVGDQILRQTKR